MSIFAHDHAGGPVGFRLQSPSTVEITAADEDARSVGSNERASSSVTAYYPGRGDEWVIAQGVSADDVGTHAGTHDTSSLMYLNPSMLRFERMGPGKAGDGQGHVGNPAKATALFGRRIVEMQVEDAARQIQKLRLSSR